MNIFATSEFWLAVALVIFLGLIVWKGTRPMLAALDKRSERIRSAIEEAEQLREEAEKTLADYKKRQREALSEAEHIISHAQAEAKRIAEQSAKELEASLARREQLAMEKIAQAEQSALMSVRGQAVDVAIAATADLLRKNLDEQRSSQLIEQGISEVAAKLN